MTVDELNSMPPRSAADALRSCCGSSRWVNEMVAKRPFESVDDILSAADQAWRKTGPDDWHEAFAHHPRIGDKRPVAAQSSRAAQWSAGEQASVQSAASDVQASLNEMNEQYENRFGHIYIVCAAGKSPADMLAIARQRLANDPQTELRVAAEEQRKITELRLVKLFGVSQ
ncbi:MAG TPA: 2-oxo-4-hydroxy-4-carboxy-5-ureidoimidazoline decarboxylase [Gemmatimonadaceae bacterium]|nr:2-oxo-4-hydroxy-4-carboxy-5-ureidoimidazoline decarboxylase [Gemmatimonadaceae bacterium]